MSPAAPAPDSDAGAAPALTPSPVADGPSGAHDRLARIIEAALDAVITVDHRGRIIEFNPAAERLFGHAAATVLGRDMAAVIIPPALRSAHHHGMNRHLETGLSTVLGRRVEVRAMRADGSEFPCELSIVRLAVAGSPVFTAFLRDITERQAGEEQLRRARAELARLVAERTADLSSAVQGLERAQTVARIGAIEVDVTTGERTWSSEAYRILGFDETEGPPGVEAILARIHPDDRERVARIVSEGYAGKLWEPFDYRIVLPGFGVRWLRSVANLFTDPRTGRSKIASTLQDITARKETELELERTTRRLARAQTVGRLGFVDIDRHRGTRLWSPVMFELFGFPPAAEAPPLSAMLGRVHPDDRPRVQALIDRSYATGELAGVAEYRLLLPDGKVRWVRNVAQHETDNRDRIMSIYLDITDLKEAQEAEGRRAAELATAVTHLDRTRQRLERAQSLARVGDAERYVGTGHRVWSRQMLLLHGFPADIEIPSRDEFLARVHPEDRQALINALTRADHGDDIPPFDYRVILPRGGVRWLRVQTETTVEPGKGVVRVASSTYDVTEQKAAEAEMARALEQERELGKLKADFLHMVTHEYRTPLGIITSAAEILERYFDRLTAEQRKEKLHEIRQSARRLADLMEEVLFLGKAETGTIPLELQPLDFATFVQGVAREVMTTFGSEREVHISVAPLPAHALADEKLLRHILTNLVSNALKYSKLDQPVWIEITDASDAFHLVVRDAGIGIPVEDQPRIFEMFQRASNVGPISGTGLGLVVVKRCVDLWGGTIALRSAVGRGTQFTVRLPYTPPVPHRSMPPFPLQR